MAPMSDNIVMNDLCIRNPPIAPGDVDNTAIGFPLKALYIPPSPLVDQVKALRSSGVINPLYSGHVIKIPSAAVSLAFRSAASTGKLAGSWCFPNLGCTMED